MANKILIEFQAKGAGQLKGVIDKLATSQKNLERAQKSSTQAQTKANQQGMLAVRNLRNQGKAVDKLGVRFSVLRSQLLLASFGFGLVNASILKLGRAYGEQEQAERRLAGLLGKSSDNLSEYAGELQKVTRFGDEETIAAMGLVAAYTEDERAIAQLTKAAQDLATVKGMDLKTATDMLSKSVFSSTNSMQRYGIQIEGTAGSSTRLNSALKTINAQMGGAAIRDSETYLGSIDQMSNAMGDLAERIGEKLAPAIISVATTMKSFVESFDEDKMKAYGVTIGVVSAGLLIYQTRVNGAAVANRVFNSTLGKLGLALTAIVVAAEGLNYVFGLYDDSVSEVKDATEDLNFVLMDNINLSKEDSKLVAQKFMLGQKYNRLIRERNLIEENSSSLFQTRIGEDQRITALTNKKSEAEKLLQDFQTRRIKGHLTEQEKLNTVEIEGTQQYLTGIELKNKADQADLNLKKMQASITLKNVTASMKLGESYTDAGQAAVDASKEAIRAKIRQIAADGVASMMAKVPFPANIIAIPAVGAIVGSGLEQLFSGMAKIKFEHGGYVGGRRHSQGGTTIEAERCEFVMNRRAVESIGVNNLEAMNEGGVGASIVINNPIISSQFVEEELPELISEAVRKGADFGMS